jgi:ABC-2 type transport system ATP-binding protein
MIAIQTQNLSKIYNNKKVVDDVSISINEGQVFGFLGPNGAGKTTTIRMLLNLIRPSSGTSKILGFDVKTEYFKVSKDVAAIVENPTFFPYLTGMQTMRTFSDYCGLTKTKYEIEQLLDKCGISDSSNQSVDKFSLGMKQRLGIAVALLNNPKVIFLDEPTNGLDPSGIVETRKLIRQLASEENRTVFISSHLLNEVEQICDEVAILNQGKIKVTGKVGELLQNKRISIKATPIIEATKVLHKVFQVSQTLEEFFHETIQAN